MNEEEKQRIEKIINKCKECRLNECMQCEISYTDICAISRLYNDYLKYKEELATSIIPSYEETIQELEKQLFEQQESKDKIIDLMANHIATSDSELCEYLDITAKCKYYAGDNGKTCDSCIKQYFENKAKEEK